MNRWSAWNTTGLVVWIIVHECPLKHTGGTRVRGYPNGLRSSSRRVAATARTPSRNP